MSILTRDALTVAEAERIRAELVARFSHAPRVAHATQLEADPAGWSFRLEHASDLWDVVQIPRATAPAFGLRDRAYGPTFGPDDRCTVCAEHIADPHAPFCVWSDR